MLSETHFTPGMIMRRLGVGRGRRSPHLYNDLKLDHFCLGRFRDFRLLHLRLVKDPRTFSLKSQ